MEDTRSLSNGKWSRLKRMLDRWSYGLFLALISHALLWSTLYFIGHALERPIWEVYAAIMVAGICMTLGMEMHVRQFDPENKMTEWQEMKVGSIFPSALLLVIATIIFVFVFGILEIETSPHAWWGLISFLVIVLRLRRRQL